MMKKLVFGAIASAVLIGCAGPIERKTEMREIRPTQDEVRAGYKKHATLAQYYRWFQIYERPSGGLENALDALDKNVTVVSGLGTASGHADYSARVQSLPANWKNAHHVKSTHMEFDGDEHVILRADIIYQNVGVLPEGKVREANLSYISKLSPDGELLPKISEVAIKQNSETEAQAFDDAYAENRAKSLVHYWLAIIENPERDAKLAQEILAENFALNFSSGKITDFGGFADWLAGPGSQVDASTHIIENFEVIENSETEYLISMEFDWHGLLPNGSPMQARTKHNWTVSNDVTERFAKIKLIDVDVVEPFRVVEP